MVLLKKTLQVEERYPYPVRLEAMYEVIDQSPMRKLEKLRQKGFVQKCKGAGVEGQVEEGTLTGEQEFRGTQDGTCLQRFAVIQVIVPGSHQRRLDFSSTLEDVLPLG